MCTHAHGVGVRMRMSETAATRTGAFGRDRVCASLELVRQRRKVGWVAAGSVGERLREQPVGEPGVPGQKRAVEVRADRATDSGSFVAALAVIAEAGDH